MQPYQEEAEAIKRQGEMPFRAAKTAAMYAPIAGAAAGAGNQILKRVAPFLSEYLPQNLAIKGLSKIDPRLGKFIQTALDNGQTWNEVKDFIGSKFQESEEPQKEKKKPAKENRNIIEQYSPELLNFMKEQISGGRPAIQAAAIAQNDKRFGDVIKKMMKDHKLPWSAIVESVFGKDEGQAQPMQNQPQ